jgi:DNA polymerase-3 subunit gamma/tau
MGYEPLHHKYRPQTFDELVGQDAIATTLSNALGQQRIAPAYLFCGPRGTGKTSSARILAKSLNCLSREAPTAQPCGTCEVCRGINVGSLLDIVEIDAASNTGVDNIRELIERAQFAPVQCRYKVYVIDECHMLSTAAFNALLKTLEEPPEQVIFVLATTDPQRVLPTIISRCQRFDFRRIPLDAMVSHLATIAQQEAIEITDEAVRLVAQVAQGGLRDAESLLDQLSLLEPPVTAEKVWDLVGAVPERDLLALTSAIAADDSVTALETARRLMDRGREPIIVLQNLAGFYRDLLIAKTASGRSDLVAVTPNTWDAMQALVPAIALPTLLHGQQVLRAAEVQLKNTTQPRLWLEVTLMGLLPSAITTTESAPPATPPHPTAGPSNGHLPPPIRPVGTASAPPEQAPPPARGGGVAVPKGLDQAPETIAPPRPADHPAAHENPPAPVAAAAPSTPASPSGTDSGSPPRPTESSAPPSPSPADLAQVWAQVVGRLHPLGTRALMQQQGHLLSFEGQAARIGIKSQPLFKMAKGRVANIEAAFEQVFQKPVTVTLEVAELPNEPAASGSAMGADRSQGSILPPVQPLPSPPSPPAAPTTADPKLTSPPVSPSPTSPEPPASQASEPTAWTPESDFDRAVKSFADFFNGQVVDTDDVDLEGKSSPSQPPAPGAPDSDVPF